MAHRLVRLALAASAAAAVAGVPAHAAGDMSVATFLGKAESLLSQGPMALFSSDAGLLKREAAAARAAYLARLGAERARGQPSSCPPPRATIGQRMMMTHLRSYPAAQRAAIPMRTAMADLYARHWPCR